MPSRSVSYEGTLMPDHLPGIDQDIEDSWVSRDVTSFVQISTRHVGVPRVSNLWPFLQ